MRRNDKEIREESVIEDIIRRTKVCHLAMCHKGVPYVVPLNFGFENRRIYFHSAREGRKIRLLMENPQVCFAFTLDDGVIPGEAACEWGARYRSVIGSGRVRFVDDVPGKTAALDIIMRQYATGKHSYASESIARTLVFVVEVETLSGKQA